ncbi:MAG: DsbA family protein, partial [Candidatus Micrarchaeota archaeon]|nr:DsbA family protein [Candidatus Micrarchaeota archaeon]
LSAFLQKHPEISLEFRVLPIPTHENSDLAAKAGFCAQEQNAFWQMHDALFAAQPNHSLENLMALAQAQGLDVPVFETCLDAPATQDRLDAEIAAGKAAGIYGTPTFFLNNVSLVGPQTEGDFEKALSGEQVEQPGVQGGACPPPDDV